MLYADLKEIYFNGPEWTRDKAQHAMLEAAYYLPLYLSIGIKGSEGGDYFNVDVFNIGWVRKEKFMIRLHSIVVDFDNFDDLEKELKILVNSIEGETWEDIVKVLRKYYLKF